MRCGSTNEVFAVASAGHSASLIVRVRPGTDHRRIADSAGHLVCCSAGRSRCRQVTVLIKRNGTNGAVSIVIGDYEALPGAARALFFGSLHLLQSVPAILGEEIFLVRQFDPVCF